MSEAARLLANLTATGRTVKTLRAKVSAYREDGLVNLSYGTAPLYGIPCLSSYTNRAVGDVVQVLDLGSNTWVVLGRLGAPDVTPAGPTTQNVGYSLYNTPTMLLRGYYDPGYEGYVGTNGAAGDLPVLLAWTYYNGTSNVLTTGAAGKTTVSVAVARSNVAHGQREAVNLQLCPHNFNALPTGTTPISLDTDSFTPVLFRLEIGEMRMITLPTDWVAAIKAATPTIKGFAVQPVTTTPWQSSYTIFSPTSGGFRAV